MMTAASVTQQPCVLLAPSAEEELVENVDVFSTRTTTYDCRQATRGRERGALPGMVYGAECTGQWLR
jgi:hypothetical protein